MIVLPWPDKRLTPNAKRRTHWTVYREPARKAREDACILACVSMSLARKKALAATEGKIPVTITFYPPDARHRDDDGMIGAFKHARDGIADALGVDDSRFRPTYHVAEPSKPGRVVVVFG
jgi:crossover junction endodeoxyribonuclease RusA